MSNLTRIASLKTVDAFLELVATLGIDLPCDYRVETGTTSPLVMPVENVRINGKSLFNRWAVHPMEGWDAGRDGRPTAEVRRRWQRFGESGAAMIWGGEAMAIVPEGRANPHQLVIRRETRSDLAGLIALAREAHQHRMGQDSEPVIGFQLTHSGRFCRPNSKELEPRVAFRHPILDERFHVTEERQVLADDEVQALIPRYVEAARVAMEAGADFVDIKHCHGYLLHEFLGAHTRPGVYGGSFENRTRILREIVAGIRADGNPIEIGVRLSAFDFVPFRPDPALSGPGKPGPGIPADLAGCLPYVYGFGVSSEDPTRHDLREAHAFLRLCHELGIRLVNLTAGSPYYNPHIQRPAAYPPSDGYLPPEDPLVGVARQVQAVRELKAGAPKDMVLFGTGYTYLQEYLPLVAQAVLRAGWVDSVGIGRMVLSYPGIFADAVEGKELLRRSVCRTFSDCTTAPRNGLVSGCFPLDPYYASRPEAQQLKAIKAGSAERRGHSGKG
ncbi:MAG: NADH:flavin oxidoreductase [Limisphaerales bacterium]|jgi:NADPH2 dehydrogenase